MQDESSIQQQKIPNAQKVFLLISIINLLVSLDHGIIPAASVQIQINLKLDNQQLGILGSLVYAGTVVMGFLASFIFLKYDPLKVIEISMITMIASLMLFTQEFNSTWPYYISRFITGGTQAPLIVYFPVWVDTFGQQKKTLWLTILQSGVPFGVFVGYVISSIIASQCDWRWAFYLQIAILIPGIILLSSQPIENIDVRPYVKDNQNNEFEKMPYTKLLKLSLQSQSYVLLTIVLGMLYFSVTGIQFWISNYLVTVLSLNQQLVNTLFSLDSISGPTLGCILGGLTTQYFGGYDNKNAYYIISIAATLGSIFSALTTTTTTLYMITIYIWLLLFFGGALVPILTGIVLSSVNQGMRSFANSNTTTYVNLFGYLPAPLVYGYLTSISPNLGLYCLMYCPAVGCIIVYIATYLHFKKLNKVLITNDKSLDSMDMQPPSVRSTSMVWFVQNLHQQSEDTVREIFEFHTIPINNITTTLCYEKSA